MLASWWAAALEEQLSQGDIFEPFPLGGSVAPPCFLPVAPHATKDRTAWTQKAQWEADKQGFGHFVSRGRFAHVIVLSHHCELDKGIGTDGRMNVTVSPLRPMSDLEPNARDEILQGKKLALMPLVSIPGRADHYADLRSIMSMQLKLLRQLSRQASMSPEGVLGLQAFVAGFFSRRQLSAGEMTGN